jgi:PemK-like, MazF-like toxin of type II toxin-antitoxin system
VTRNITPWQVWWADFDPQIGQEQTGRRPAIVVGTTLACSLPDRLVITTHITLLVRSNSKIYAEYLLACWPRTNPQNSGQVSNPGKATQLT